MEMTAEHKHEWLWPGFTLGWLLASFVGFLIVALGVPLAYGGPVSMSGAILGLLFAPVATFPMAFIRLIIGRQAPCSVALCAGSVAGLLYAPITYELFLPLAHRLTNGPTAEMWAVFGAAGLVGGAVWFKVENMSSTNKEEKTL